MSVLNCVYSNCENNDNEVHIAETVAKKDLSLDIWMNFDEYFATFNSGLNVPTPGRVKNMEVAPICILIYQIIQRHHSVKPLVCLFDGDSSCSLVNAKNIPVGATPTLMNRQSTTTASGIFNTSQTVHLTDIKLSEFST